MSVVKPLGHLAAHLHWAEVATLIKRWRPVCAISILFILTLAGAAAEETFPLLKIGDRSYTNVTVTTKAKTYIFILHDGGMANIKISALPQELKEKLGYSVPAAATNALPGTVVAETNNADAACTDAANADTGSNKTIEILKQRMLAGLNSPQIRRWLDRWSAQRTAAMARLASVNRIAQFEILGAMFLIYLYFSYCCSSIYKQAGFHSDLLVWVPVLQVIPMLHAAGMKRRLFFLCLLPGVSLVMYIIWSIKITKVCGKNPLVALLLIFPLTSFLTFAYLAHSGASAAANKPQKFNVANLRGI